ncbi:hypothetical protein AGOR_G00116140 [Albula goreensis]|uniref:Uncharacterized protein n=1 Tax=Albula goreensis TaxID=1534307 RepID=A0A8T3DE20_9TELE|nr:hypothetical protein AGOR_G00116140 [Albula goreensis]
MGLTPSSSEGDSALSPVTVCLLRRRLQTRHPTPLPRIGLLSLFSASVTMPVLVWEGDGEVSMVPCWASAVGYRGTYFSLGTNDTQLQQRSVSSSSTCLFSTESPVRAVYKTNP